MSHPVTGGTVMKTVRISCLVIGLSMLLQWGFFILTGNVPEFRTAPVSISFHIFIEVLTALLLIFGAVLYSRKDGPIRYLVVYAQGMLGYTAVNSAGYFVQSGQWIFLGMFFLVVVVSVNNTRIVIKCSA
jgi:hypothetical protein